MPPSLERMRELRNQWDGRRWSTFCPSDLEIVELLDASIALARLEAWLHAEYGRTLEIEGPEGPPGDGHCDDATLVQLCGCECVTAPTLLGALSAALDRAEEKT